MALDFATDQQQQPQQGEQLPIDFYRGANFLGRPVTVALAGQEPGGPAAGGSPDALAVGGAPVGPTSTVSPGGAPGPTTGGATSGGLTDLQRATEALGVLQKTGRLAGELTKDTGTGDRPGVDVGGGLAAATPGGGGGTVPPPTPDAAPGGGFDPTLPLMQFNLTSNDPLSDRQTVIRDLVERGVPAEQIQQILATQGGGTGVGELPGAAIPSGETATASLGPGTGAAGAGALSAILSLIASETGDPKLARAAKAASALAGAGSLAVTGADLAATGGTLAAEGATASAAGAAGAAFAPITAALLASTISGLFGGEDPAGEGIAEIMAGTPHFQEFVSGKLMPSERTQGTAFQALQDALPYVQSQEQLGQLLSTMNQYVTTNTGIDLPKTDPFTISAIPGIGEVTHGQQTQPLDWAGRTQGLQALVNALKGRLPEKGGGPVDQLWNQFVTRNIDPAQAPLQVTKPDGSVAYMTPDDYQGWYNQQAEPAVAAGGALPVPEFMAGVVKYGEPGYDYAGAGLLAPGATPGAPSSAWQQLLAMTGQSPEGIPPAEPGPAPDTESAPGIADIPGVGVSGGQLFPVA
jgi:hypothetical protein